MYIYLSVLAFSVSISCLFFPFVIGCRCPGVRSSSEKSTIFCSDIRPEVEPRKFGLCKPCYFPSYPLCPRYQDFEQRISRYIVTSFAVNVTLEVADIYDSSEKSTIFCSDIRPEVEPRKFGLCKPCYFPSYPLCPRYQDFEQRISRYIVTSFAVNVTLEVADIYDLITRLNLVGLSTIKEFFLERRELFLRTA